MSLFDEHNQKEDVNLMVDFFETEKLQDGLTAIHTLSGEILYLIEGSKKAILVDTSVGVKGLRAFVDKLTSLPLTVVITHGHIDHAMGAPEFKDVDIYMSHKDMDVYAGMQNIAGRMEYVSGNRGGQLPEGMTAADFVEPVNDVDFKDIKEGDSFDLGGVHVDIYDFPGHTQGSIALLIREMRIVITGDACNPFIFLFFDYSSKVCDYKETVQDFKQKLAGKYDHIYLSHGSIGNVEADLSLFDNTMDTCNCIMEGKTDEIPFDFMGEPAFIAKAMTPPPAFERLDGGYGNIVYNKNRIF